MRRIPITLQIPAPLLLLGVAAVAFFTGMLVVRAMGDVTSSTTAMNTLTFAGTISRTGDVPLTFRFFKGPDGVETPVCKVDVTAKVDASGNFAVQIPLSGADCKRADLFDGGDAKYRIDVDGTPLDMRMAYVTGVPYAQVAEHYASPDCPLGYTRSTAPEDAKFVVCKKGVDEVVKVGTGPTAFWIDRYEATVWADQQGSVSITPDVPFGSGGGAVGIDDYPASFPDNGQRTNGFKPLFALSIRAVDPSRMITWFQAQQSCFSSGKTLPTDSQWFLGASGTPDDATCNNDGTGLSKTGMLPQCVSSWGAQDMVGNVAEWTETWYAGTGDGISNLQANQGVQHWPLSIANDGTWNLNTWVNTDATPNRAAGLPAASLRGGSAGQGSLNGVFSHNLNFAPSKWASTIGFRCVIPR